MKALASACIGGSIGFGCGGPSDVATPSGPSDGVRSITQASANVWVDPATPFVALLMVDGAPTDEARALRAFLAEDVKNLYSRENCGVLPDPASWQPVDVRVVVIDASDPTRTLTPDAAPALSLISPNPTSEEETRFESALADAVLATEASETRPLLALAELEHWSRMLRAEVAPRSDVERRFMATVPSDIAVVAHIATTRDDESPGAPMDYRILVDMVHGLNGEPVPASCEDPPGQRFGGLYGASWGAASCDRATLFPDFCGDSFDSCVDWRPRARDDGQRDCRVLAHTPELGPCPRWAGWVDPLNSEGERVPLVVETESGQERVCEVLQLEGEALESCRTDLDCSDCDAGFCVTELAGTECFAWSYVRFTLGSNSAQPARLRITCDVE
jgi:hypothetical protein